MRDVFVSKNPKEKLVKMSLRFKKYKKDPKHKSFLSKTQKKGEILMGEPSKRKNTEDKSTFWQTALETPRIDCLFFEITRSEEENGEFALVSSSSNIFDQN